MKLIKQEECFREDHSLRNPLHKNKSRDQNQEICYIQEQFQKNNIMAFKTHLHEREALRALFPFGGQSRTWTPGKWEDLKRPSRTHGNTPLSSFLRADQKGWR